jgi:GT2 family glycosyltransferase
MKVFAVIVTYNGMKWIDKCLEHITKQCEVVVVDNNSNDQTVDFISKNYPKVWLLRQESNLGFGGANNVGISYAINKGGEAVFLLNQDVYVQQDCIENLIKAYSRNKEFGVISPIHFNGDGNALDYSFQKVTYMSPLISDLITRNFSQKIYDFKFMNAAAWFIPKEVLSIVGGFDPLFFMYGEDDNYCQRILYHNFKIGVIPDAFIYHDSDNNNYVNGEPGTEKYYQQFLNKVLIKYANINTESYKSVGKLKLYLFRKAILSMVTFKVKKSKLFLNKLKKIQSKRIVKSVIDNRIAAPNYLVFK